MYLRHFLPGLVSIKREYLPKSTKIHQIFHAISGTQKNPRRSSTLTGIYAINSKLKYGAFSFPSTMLILKQAENRQKMALFSFQSGNKAAKSASFLFCQSGNEAVKMAVFWRTQSGRKAAENGTF